MAADNVKITTDTTLETELVNAGSKLVVIDFHATWCAPCKRIAPVFAQLSRKYPQALFLKVDVDQCPNMQQKYSVTAMPTFVFLRSKVVIDKIQGGDPNALQDKVKEHVGNSSSDDGDDEEVKGHGSLASFINPAGCNCLNESDDHVHSNVFKKEGGYLESDCDEQLILTIEFNQAVKLHSLKIDAPNDGRGPKIIKLFTNQPNAVDFDQADRMEGVQQLELTPEDITGEKLIPLRFVKFQNVSNLVVFVFNNQGGEETTAINYIKIIGSPLDATNMKDFKRVAGKAGESH
ncbi:thioredoxin-like protein 1 [Hydractinia symbiolongicarpus]|uniref:thioredoxin-like protein 1 n=1 Tax=Hydractinia symbiolongicarpus TaxID=13093 RepID=UPI002551A866|nr:thioredoxin-like protein 1 [Hydractinia symbiolongicarpus]